jgi:predicted  nucleic acid-binding Zn-ribbon protein
MAGHDENLVEDEKLALKEQEGDWPILSVLEELERDALAIEQRQKEVQEEVQKVVAARETRGAALLEAQGASEKVKGRIEKMEQTAQQVTKSAERTGDALLTLEEELSSLRQRDWESHRSASAADRAVVAALHQQWRQGSANFWGK